ncbi:hypothetical protein [Legionella sp.]|nr:hypothetical protein [Legionella sp.]PJE11398.1 MAG: hypothetical protein CK430_09000 [Legionella sp.]
MQPLPIPGHHGSASGNRYNQQGVEVPESIVQRDTTTVQDLVLCKLFDFLNRCTGDRFSQENCHEVRLKHEQLDGVLNDFLNQNQSKRNEKLLTHYNAVLENIHAFIWFQEGSYARLGAQYAKDKQRFVHLHGHNHMPMEAAVPTLHQDFINQEHALLYLRGFVNFEKFENSLAGMIHATTETLKDTIARMFNSSKESSRASSSSFDGQGLLNLLQEEAGRKIFFNGLAVLIETLSQKYLRNNLSSEEDEALRNVIEEPFRIIQRVKEEIAKQADFPKEYELIINQFDDLIQTGFKHTIETHYASIIQQTDALKAQIEHLLNPPEHFYTVFHEFVIKLPEPDNDTPEELTQVKEYLLRIESSRIRSIEDIQKVLSESIASLGEVSEEKLEVIQAFISSKQSELLQPCFDIHQASDETYLINLERLYDLAKTLKKDYPAQQRLVSKEKIDIDLEQLNFRIDTLVKAGGILLKERTIDLRQKPDCVGEAFFNLIKQEAIKLGAPSPELEDLKREILKQEQLLDELKQQNTKLLEKEKAQQSVIENQESQMVRKAQDHLEKTRALEKQIGEIREQKEQEAQRFEHSSSAQQETISKLEDKIGKATEQNKALNQRLERLSGENSEEIRSLKETVQSQAEEIGRLVGQWVLLSSDTQKDKELIEKLQSQEEAEKIVLIQTKLLPFTNNYLTHLLQQAQKYQPELRLNPDGTLPELLQPLFESDKEVYDKIITKLELVINLKSILQDTNERPLPSERVQAFGEALLRANDALKIHRDGPWTRFFKSSALVLGFAFELAYTVVTGKRNPLFFVTHTQGEAYVDDCAKELGLENPAVGA